MTIIENFSKLTRTFAYSYSSSNLNTIIQYHNNSALNTRHLYFSKLICRRYCALKTRNTLLSRIIGSKIKGYSKSSLATSNGTTDIVANNYDTPVTPFEGPVADETNLRSLGTNYLPKGTSIYKGK